MAKVGLKLVQLDQGKSGMAKNCPLNGYGFFSRKNKRKGKTYLT